MTEIITRACGHTQEFVPHGDRFDEARREKLRRKRCPACGVLKNLEDNARQGPGSGKLRKGSEVKSLPDGTTVLLVLTDDGWSGRLMADGVTVETISAGAMGILNKLARKWLAARGRLLQGKVHE